MSAFGWCLTIWGSGAAVCAARIWLIRRIYSRACDEEMAKDGEVTSPLEKLIGALLGVVAWPALLILEVYSRILGSRR